MLLKLYHRSKERDNPEIIITGVFLLLQGKKNFKIILTWIFIYIYIYNMKHIYKKYIYTQYIYGI